MDSTLYDREFFLWTVENARSASAALTKSTLNNLVEEIESMGRSDQRQFGNRLEVLLCHLLKWRHQHAKRSRSSVNTIDHQRVRLERLLGESPSLRAA